MRGSRGVGAHGVDLAAVSEVCGVDSTVISKASTVDPLAVDEDPAVDPTTVPSARRPWCTSGGGRGAGTRVAGKCSSQG
jgi:hypothetical protein